MQVAGDPLPLGDFGQMLDLFIRLAQFTVHPIALSKECISRANDDREKRRVEQSPAVDVQDQAFSSTDDPDRGQPEYGSPLRIDAEWQHGRGINEECARPSVDWHEQHAEQNHSADVNKNVRVLKGKQ